MRNKKFLVILFSLIILIVSLAIMLFPQTTRDIFLTEEGKAEEPSQRLALLVGVEEYEHHPNIRNLRYTVEDTEAMKSVLEGQGGFTVKSITSESDIQPTKDNILDSLYDALWMAEDGDLKTFVFYFGGHGFQIDGKNYMAVMETDPDPDNIPDTALELDEVMGILEDIRDEAKVMVFLDACRNDPFQPRQRDQHVNTGLGEMHKLDVCQEQDFDYSSWDDLDSTGFKVLYSTSEGEVSYEVGQKKHGLFTYFLSKGLKGEADIDGDGSITFNESSKYTYMQMRSWAKKYPKMKQTPKMDMKEAIGDFFLTLSDSGKTIENGLSISLLGWKDGVSNDWFSLNEGGTLRSGDAYKVKLTSDEKYYVYIYQVDATGAIYPLFPRPDIAIDNPVKPYREYHFPEDLNMGFELDDNTGEEVVYVYATVKENDRLAWLSDYLYKDENYGYVSFKHAKKLVEDSTRDFKNRGPKKKLKEVTKAKDNDGYSIHESEKFTNIGEGRIIKFTFNHR